MKKNSLISEEKKEIEISEHNDYSMRKRDRMSKLNKIRNIILSKPPNFPRRGNVYKTLDKSQTMTTFKALHVFNNLYEQKSLKSSFLN